MYRNHHVYHPTFESMGSPYSESGNSLGIEHINYNWDQANNKLVLTIETHRMISKEISAVLKGNTLTFEAPLIFFYNRPFRTHLIDPGTKEEYEEGFTVIGTSQIKLRHGYQFQLISCKMNDSRMIEVVLEYTKWGGNIKN